MFWKKERSFRLHLKTALIPVATRLFRAFSSFWKERKNLGNSRRRFIIFHNRRGRPVELSVDPEDRIILE